MVSFFCPPPFMLAGVGALVSDYIGTEFIASSSSSFSFTGQTLGQGATLFCAIDRYNSASSDSDHILGATIDSLPADHIGMNTAIGVNTSGSNNIRCSASWFVAGTAGGTGTINISTKGSTRADIISWGLNHIPILTDANVDADGSASDVNNATTSIDTLNSLLFGLAIRTSGTNSPTVSGFAPDASNVAFGGGSSDANFWAGRNLEPTDPQTVSITSVNSNRHLVSAVALR